MTRHLLAIVAIILVAIAGIFYPFMPGHYDGLAVTVSKMVQAAAIVAAILLSPIGLVWLVHEWRCKARRSNSDATPVDRRDWAPVLAIAAIVASLVVALAAAAGGMEKMGVLLGIFVLVTWAWIALRSLRAVKLWRQPGERTAKLHPAPLYLVLVPIIVALVRFAFIEPAVNWSRNRAMAAGTAYIEAIEQYQQIHGHYPLSLDSLHGDYDTGVVGVQRFHYERSGDSDGAYNVYFEQFTTSLDTREVVAYNPLDQQQMTSHDSDILEFTPEHLELTRGYYASSSAGRPHWKRFLFD
jgi:hypothetical protein